MNVPIYKTHTIIEAKRLYIKSDNFCYRKVGRAITKRGAIRKKSNIAIAILKIIE